MQRTLRVSPAERCIGWALVFFSNTKYSPCSRYPSSCRGPIQFSSFFTWQSIGVTRCMYHAQAAPLLSFLNRAIIVYFWVNDDIYKVQDFILFWVSATLTFAHWKRQHFYEVCVAELCCYMKGVSTSLSRELIYYCTKDPKATVIFPEHHNFSVFMQWALHSTSQFSHYSEGDRV